MQNIWYVLIVCSVVFLVCLFFCTAKKGEIILILPLEKCKFYANGFGSQGQK